MEKRYYSLRELEPRRTSSNMKNIRSKSFIKDGKFTVMIYSRDGSHIELQSVNDLTIITIMTRKSTKFDMGKIVELERRKDSSFRLYFESKFDNVIRVIRFK